MLLNKEYKLAVCGPNFFKPDFLEGLVENVKESVHINTIRRQTLCCYCAYALGRVLLRIAFSFSSIHVYDSKSVRVLHRFNTLDEIRHDWYNKYKLFPINYIYVFNLVDRHFDPSIYLLNSI